jgi:uncharacterized protein (DUF952 family)
MAIVYKICDAALWRQAEQDGVFRGAPVDLADGFIHFSAPHQVAETAAKHFAGRQDLMLIGVETDALGAALRWEPSRGGNLFPHLYGELPLSAVRTIQPLRRAADGTFIFAAPHSDC